MCSSSSGRLVKENTEVLYGPAQDMRDISAGHSNGGARQPKTNLKDSKIGTSAAGSAPRRMLTSRIQRLQGTPVFVELLSRERITNAAQQ